MRTMKLRCVAIILLGVLTGCATPGPFLTQDLGAIRSGIAITREQARVSFDAANKLALQQSIERKAGLPDTIIKESDFATPVSAADAAAWSNAFGILDTYGAALQSLVDPKRANDTGDAIGDLANILNGPAINAKIPASLTGLFSTFAQALVQARAEKTAITVMRRTDPAFHEVVSRMAAAIGASPRERGSLQDVVESNWTNSVLTGLDNRYQALRVGDAARKQVLTDYANAMVSRDAQLANLAQLHDSLLALGEAHAAAAAGRPGDALFWIGRINGWLDDIKRRTDAAQKSGEGK